MGDATRWMIGPIMRAIGLTLWWAHFPLVHNQHKLRLHRLVLT
jgi:hypothetical protein